MKILLINNQHYLMGGAHRAYLNTAELLKRHGHEVYFFSMIDDRNLFYEYSGYFPKAINIRNLSVFNKIKVTKDFLYNKEVYNKLFLFIEKIKPDIAHIHLFMGGLTTAILTCLKDKNVPIVHSIHDYRLICPAYLFLDGKNRICEKCKGKNYYKCIKYRCSENNLFQSTILAFEAYFRKYFINPANFIDYFIFVSQFAKDKHIEFSDYFRNKNKVLYNFIPDLENITPNKQKGRYFMFYGRLSREKGVQTLVEAASKTSIPLVIVGMGPLFDKYQNQNNKNIKFVGYKNGVELWDLVKNASFIVVPSEWYENNPLTIIEAYAYGKPVIGASIGGITEIIEVGKTGFLFKSGNQKELVDIMQMANNMTNEEYHLMSENARIFAENNFNPNQHYQQLLAIYNKFIN